MLKHEASMDNFNNRANLQLQHMGCLNSTKGQCRCNNAGIPSNHASGTTRCHATTRTLQHGTRNYTPTVPKGARPKRVAMQPPAQQQMPSVDVETLSHMLRMTGELREEVGLRMVPRPHGPPQPQRLLANRHRSKPGLQKLLMDVMQKWGQRDRQKGSR